MATYKTFLENVDKYHIYEIIASEKICLLNNKKLIKYNDDYRYDFKTSDKIKFFHLLLSHIYDIYQHFLKMPCMLPLH